MSKKIIQNQGAKRETENIGGSARIDQKRTNKIPRKAKEKNLKSAEFCWWKPFQYKNGSDNWIGTIVANSFLIVFNTIKRIIRSVFDRINQQITAAKWIKMH